MSLSTFNSCFSCNACPKRVEKSVPILFYGDSSASTMIVVPWELLDINQAQNAQEFDYWFDLAKRERLSESQFLAAANRLMMTSEHYEKMQQVFGQNFQNSGDFVIVPAVRCFVDEWDNASEHRRVMDICKVWTNNLEVSANFVITIGMRAREFVDSKLPIEKALRKKKQTVYAMKWFDKWAGGTITKYHNEVKRIMSL